MAGTLLTGALLTAVALWFAARRYRVYRRSVLAATPLPGEWVRMLEQNVSLYRLLPEGLRDELQGLIHVFLAEKEFVGCDGLVITDEIRVTIAAQACLLLLNREAGFYPRLKTILVYPGAFIAREVIQDGAVETTRTHARSGESWHRGPVVLSWDDTIRGGMDTSDGSNLVLHEFAHQLDQENEFSEGAPVLEYQSRYRNWSRVLGREYERLQASLDQNDQTLFGSYAGKSPAEFFAVLTETFFERPHELKSRHPELYEEVSNYYKLDPVAWHVRKEIPGSG